MFGPNCSIYSLPNRVLFLPRFSGLSWNYPGMLNADIGPVHSLLLPRRLFAIFQTPETAFTGTVVSLSILSDHFLSAMRHLPFYREKFPDE